MLLHRNELRADACPDPDPDSDLDLDLDRSEREREWEREWGWEHVSAVRPCTAAGSIVPYPRP